MQTTRTLVPSALLLSREVMGEVVALCDFFLPADDMPGGMVMLLTQRPYLSTTALVPKDDYVEVVHTTSNPDVPEQSTEVMSTETAARIVENFLDRRF